MSATRTMTTIESSLVDPFKGRTLVRSPRASSVQTISIQYDYQNKTPPQSSGHYSKKGCNHKNEAAEKSSDGIKPKNHVPKPLNRTRRPPSNTGDSKLIEALQPKAKIANEDEKLKRNYIPKGNVLARTPPNPADGVSPQEERRNSLAAAPRRNSIDYLKLSLNASHLERISMREYFEYEKDLLNSDLQSRLDNAKTKIDTGRTPTRPRRKANKGVQVSLLKVPLPRSESPVDETKRKLPEIIGEKKSKPYLKARHGKTSKNNVTANDEDKGATVEEFVLAMVRQKLH